MKKRNLSYLAMWYGGLVIITAIFVGLIFIFDSVIFPIIGFVVFIGGIVVIPQILDNQMKKNALKFEEKFAENDFSYQYKFIAKYNICYIDPDGGRICVIWRNNPTQYYIEDASKITDIRTHDGKQLRGTSLVSCQFKLAGEKFKIYTLRVSNGQLSMKSAEVLEAISKADKLCEMLRIAQQTAINKKA